MGRFPRVSRLWCIYVRVVVVVALPSSPPPRLALHRRLVASRVNRWWVVVGRPSFPPSFLIAHLIAIAYTLSLTTYSQQQSPRHSFTCSLSNNQLLQQPHLSIPSFTSYPRTNRCYPPPEHTLTHGGHITRQRAGPLTTNDVLLFLSLLSFPLHLDTVSRHLNIHHPLRASSTQRILSPFSLSYSR